MLAFSLTATGCGTTNWSDTARTGTEQLLISTAIDEAVGNIDFAPLSHREVYLDTDPLDGSVGRHYLTSCLRQRMLSQQCIVKEKLSEADYVVEVRAGTIGTDRHEDLIGIPATELSVPVGSDAGAPASVPEIALAKSTNQRGVAKVGCFAYRRETGQAFWQSGVVPMSVNAKETRILGFRSFNRGTLYDRTQFVEDHAPRGKQATWRSPASAAAAAPAAPSDARPATQRR
ncbi:MAG TPA: DUF6655 family protein [Pirellulales bacterium]|nr:DUF6655 family protein [Pirellulales bacterium]